MIRGYWLFLALLLAVTSLGCADGRRVSTGDSGTMRVVTTTSMLAELVREVGGDHVSVDGLMGPGIDPHLYKASEGDVTRMASAHVIFYNGLHLEGKMTEIFEQMRARGKPTIAVAETIPDTLLLESESFAGNYDPHVWFSVRLWTDAARVVAGALGELEPEHAAEFEERAERYIESLREVEAYVRQRTEEIPAASRVLITSHDAFGYFGREYGFEVRGLQGLSTATEAGTADVQELAAFVVSRRVPALFVESSVSERGIEAVRAAARARGFEVVIGGTLYGDALGGPGSGADTYVGMVRKNIDTIVDGLTRAAGA